MSTLTLRGPAWLAVRQHRLALWSAPALLVLAAAIVIFLRLRAGAVADSYAGSDCSAQQPTFACEGTVREFLDTQFEYSQWLNYMGLPLFVLPGVVGAFVAGPMIARELESGTYKLAWTQSVTPARWLMVKLAVPTAWTVAFVSVAVPLHRWAWATRPVEDIAPGLWHEPVRYAGMGPLPVAYALLGIAAGALVGLLVRRTVVALSVTALAMGTVMMLFITQLRVHLWPTVTAMGDERDSLGSGWVIEQGVVLASGERVTHDECVAGGWRASPCLKVPDGATRFAEVHPVSHFWPLQLVETGIILVLVAAVTFAAFRVLGRRHR